jgi:hypothetical protein
MPRSRLLLIAVFLTLVFLPHPGWSVKDTGTLDQLAARAKAFKERNYRDKVSETEIRNLESGFIFLLRQDPENQTVAAQLALFYVDWNWTLKNPAPALLDCVRTSRNPTGLAQIFIQVTGEGAHALQTQITLAAIASRPADFVLWDMAAKVAPDVAWKIAFQEEAFRLRLAAPAASSGTPSAPALAARWLRRLLTNGLLHRALIAYRELAPEVRTHIDDDSAVPDGLFNDHGDDRRDLRLELAAAAFLDGDRETAGRLLRIATQYPAVRRPVRENEHDPLLLLGRTVERALAAPQDDGFDLLTQHLAQSLSVLEDPALVQFLLTARLAAREAYPALAAYDLERISNFLGQRDKGALELDPGLPARLWTVKEGIDADMEALSQSLKDESQAAEAAARTTLGPDPVAPLIARLLATPAASVFAEHPLPKGIEPVRLSDQQTEARLKAAAQRVHLPPGLNVVRVEQKGQRVAAVVASQSLDPAGEVSAGGYWVLLSKDGGATWGAPLYTGLRINQPHVVRPISNLPLFDGDHLRLEVEIRELDPSLIVFPPINLSAKRTAQGLFLDLPLAALTRDSDGDGLTDLTEMRLLTDPYAADSDGDGIADGDDLLPGVSQSADNSAATQALAAVVKRISGVGSRALIEGVAGTPAGVICCGPRKGPPVIEPTVFFIGERPLFAGLNPDRRVVILTRAEADAASKIFGLFFPTKIELFLLDHTGHRAFVIWSASWQGGTLSLKEENGQWTVHEISSWIT